ARTLVRFEQMRGARAQRAIGEQLDRTDAQKVAAGARAEIELGSLEQLTPAHSVIHAQCEIAGRLENAERRQAVLVLEVLQPGKTGRRGKAERCPNGRTQLL